MTVQSEIVGDNSGGLTGASSRNERGLFICKQAVGVETGTDGT